MGEAGDARGNCDYTKHNAWLLSWSLVHSSGSISLQQLTVSTAPTSTGIMYSTGITCSPMTAVALSAASLSHALTELFGAVTLNFCVTVKCHHIF